MSPCCYQFLFGHDSCQYVHQFYPIEANWLFYDIVLLLGQDFMDKWNWVFDLALIPACGLKGILVELKTFDENQMKLL